MTRPYSMDLRERMVRAVEAGASRRATAAKFDVSPSCVVKLLQRWHQKGTLEPAPGSGGRRAKLADHAERVQALLAAAPDSTIAELRSRLAAGGTWRNFMRPPGSYGEEVGTLRTSDGRR